jgi:hypothetical protein
MPTWIVRTNCEYSLAIEAETAEEAMQQAEAVPYSEWGQAWAEYEAELEDEEEA